MRRTRITLTLFLLTILTCYPVPVATQEFPPVVEIEGVGSFDSTITDGRLVLSRRQPATTGGKVKLAINPVYIDGEPSVTIPGDWHTEIRHLRAESAPTDDDPLDVWDAFLYWMREQVRELARIPTTAQNLHLSSDGMGYDPWPAETHRMQALLPPGVGFEIFSPLASRQLGGSLPGSFRSVGELSAKQTWVRRTRAAARRTSPEDGHRGMSLTFGSFCTLRHNPVVLMDFLAAQGVTATSLWAIEGWSQRVGDEIYPWARHRGRGAPWDLHTLDDRYFDRVEATAARAEEHGITLYIYLFDRSGLRNINRRGRWPWHPFNADNSPAGIEESVPSRGYPRGVWATGGPFWDEVIVPFLLRFRGVAERHQNVILVLCNEATRDMAPDPVGWHRAVAAVLED